MKAISLGWGTQSFALAAMSALGVLPHIDAAIHADTTHERSSTYAFAERWTPWLEEHGVRVITVKPKRCTSPVVNDWGGVFIPAFTIGEEYCTLYLVDGEWETADWLENYGEDYGGEPPPVTATRQVKQKINGQLRRQCTGDWKIRPIRRWLQANRNRQPVELWLGITLDEAQRMNKSKVKYITNRWPFLEPDFWNGRRMRRSDVVRWLRDNLGDDAVPDRSACYFCPFHSKREWRDLRDNGNGDWQKAVEFDKAIRKMRPPFDLFISQDRVPLVELDLSTPADHGQMSLWENECEGMCGI